MSKLVSNQTSIVSKIAKASVTIAFVAMVGVSTNANASMRDSTEASLQSICYALKSDNKLRLNRAIKQSRISYKAVAEGLMCNGKTAMEFALFNNAKNTAVYLAKKANIKHNGMLARR